MAIEHLIAFNIALFAAMASPGPAFLITVKTALTAGRSAGIALGFGLAVMASTWTAMAFLGLEAIFRLFPWAYAVVKAIGAIYLLYIAYGMWRGAHKSVSATVKPARHAFRQGILINMLNPKSVLFAAAVLIVIFPTDTSMAESSIVVLNQLIMEILFYTALAFGMSTQAVSQQYLKAKAYIDRTASLILGALGLRLLLNR